MGASALGDQRAPPSPFPPEPPELEPLAPELVLEPPELDPLEPLEPLDPEEPLDAPDPPAFPELEVPEPDPLPEPLGPADPSGPASMALVSSEKPGTVPPPPPEHPIDKARQPMRASGRARTRASSVIMNRTIARDVPDRSYRRNRGICAVFVRASEMSALLGDNQKVTLTCAAMRRCGGPPSPALHSSRAGGIEPASGVSRCGGLLTRHSDRFSRCELRLRRRTMSTRYPLRAALPIALSLTCLCGVVQCGQSNHGSDGAPPTSGGSGNAPDDSGAGTDAASSPTIGGDEGGASSPTIGGDEGGASSPTIGGDEGGVPGSTGTTADGAAPTGDGGGANILVPAQGVLLGEYYGNGTIAATEQMIGRSPNIHLTYYGWTEDWTNDSVPKADFAAGRIPLVNLEPDNIDFNDIVSGSLDATIKARASGSKKLGHPFFLDFAAEMNGDEAWSGNDPALYVAAYRHIHDLFVAAGATNVIWAWCPNVTDTNGGNAMTMAYYPGDAYVDWTGVDGYNWGTSDPNFGWQSFRDVFKDIYPLLAAKGKPILVGEMASDEVGGSKSQWIADMIPTLRTDFSSIKAFVWFDVKKERDWEINSSTSSLAAYVTLAADPFTNP